MGDPEIFEGRRETYVWVKDRKGNEYMCPPGALKDPEHATAEELENCVDDASAGVNPRGG